MSTGGGITVFDRALERERQPFRKRREHELSCESQQVERLRALVAIEGAQRHVAFRSADERIAERQQLGDFTFTVPPAACRLFDEIREPSDARQPELRQTVAHVGIGMLGEEIRQLHDVAVGVVERAALRICHERTPERGPLRHYRSTYANATATAAPEVQNWN